MEATTLPQLLSTLPVTVTHFTLLSQSPYDALPQEQVLIDAFRSPTFLPNLTALHSWHHSYSQSWATRALPAIAACLINETGARRPIQFLEMNIGPDMFSSLAELRQVTTLEMRHLWLDVDWVTSAAAFPSFLPHLQTLRLQCPANFPAPKPLQSLLQFLSTRPVRELIISCSTCGGKCQPLSKAAWNALTAMRLMHTLTIACNAGSTSSEGLTTSAARLRLLLAGAWPALRSLNLTAFALTSAELTAVVNAAPNLHSIKLYVAPDCSSVCIPIIGQHCAELRELQLLIDSDNRRVRRKQLLRALDARRPSSVSLLPCLERLRVCMLDDAAVYLLLHRLQASPLQWVDVIHSVNSTSSWTNALLVAVLCQCPRLRTICVSGQRCRSSLEDFLTQRDDASPTGFRFLQRLQCPSDGQYVGEEEAVLREDRDSRAVLFTAMQERLSVEERHMLERWDRQADRTQAKHKEGEGDAEVMSVAQPPEEMMNTVAGVSAVDRVSGVSKRRSKRRRGV